MATLILAAAGSAVGGLFGLGGIGAILGKAVGAVAGAGVDRLLFGSRRAVEGSRLSDLTVQTSNEGAPLPLVYGRVRLAGQVIWATNFEEVVSEESAGGKGGGSSTTVRSYSYFANFAVALAEGPIDRIGRVWADGKELDTGPLTMRVYKGTEDQEPDPLIAAVQGEAPAYRGTAYVVFERLALAGFGNRIPQLAFEVIRAIEPLEAQVRAVTMIPGAGEFVYSAVPVSQTLLPGEAESLNHHTSLADTDWTASLDDLQAVCPSLESVALVVTWFGDDLRAGACRFRPKVETAEKTTAGLIWSVAGLSREQAPVVSQRDGAPAFGGTPADASVLSAIADLKARGLRVMLYPFLMMDIPEGNGLPDPYGGSEQPVYPWRGRITSTGDAASDASSFFGTVTAADFTVSSGAVSYHGPDEWSYRRHILHMAALAKAAGGVDAFLIGSELRGLTVVRAGDGSFPFVEGLAALAGEVRVLLGASTKISYAADWSEYGGRQMDGGDLRFPLDRLWANPAIDFVGIDNYLPMADMREGGDPDGNRDPYDMDVLRAGITGGEYHGWYYASDADRRAGLRSPIADGAYGKPWVFRSKDLKGWWANSHFERTGGVEDASPTAWSPMSKPIWFTELGVPAVDFGANQPNVFSDPKSSESALPYFSKGTRDDLIQRRALEASLSFWDDRHPVFPQGDNPVSPLYGGPMVDPANIHLWTWDARPYPAFPNYGDVWADGENWQTGHWLNGRLGSVSLGGLVRRLLDDFGIAPEDVSVGSLSGLVEGLAVAGPVSARQILEPLLDVFGGTASDQGTRVLISDAGTVATIELTLEDLADPADGEGILSRTRAQESELASEVRLSAEDPASDYQRRGAASRRLSGGSRDVETVDLEAVADPGVLQQAADRRLARIWGERERMTLSLSPLRLDLEPGDVLSLASVPGQSFSPPLTLRIESIEDTDLRKVEALRTGATRAAVSATPLSGSAPFRSSDAGVPHGFLIDLPVLESSEDGLAPRLATFARPWPGSMTLMRSVGDSGFEPVLTVSQPATMGRLKTPLALGPVDVLDRANAPEVEMFGGLLQTRPLQAVLAGGNALAVRTNGGGFEILQFAEAVLTGVRSWRLSRLLRGQRGTEPEMLTGAPAGADVVLLDSGGISSVPVAAGLKGLSLSYRLVPGSLPLDDSRVLAFSHAASGRGLVPLAPGHLKARRTAGGVAFSWIRQTRLSGDSWEQAEVPLAEEREAYVAEILGPGETVLRSFSLETPEMLYPAASEIADFGAQQSTLTLSVCQFSAAAGRGHSRKATLHV
ncbi:baseplate multidomain protein megatron [Roseibium litorale]|uniref:Glycoside hydrolase/phage tail family protein n=1 Tax=Roseibium litorale TaxID=2803841 RepID=A0ABR9CT68_9HYPH|nr:glycoside hydrolase/phage tail family protein [Roseibium litorale]MBD8893487.1 glycoside hydrolase/phage tail family protein [Roseibium litorale]